MAYRELELTLLSAQELKNVNLITRMDVYAVVSISGDPLTRQSTEPDTYGGRNPCWNETFRFAVPPTAAAAAGASLQVLLRAERFLGDRDVGEVVVPLSDILATATGAGPQPPQLASYQVRKLHRWEPRGVLNVSYRLGPVVAPVVVAERAPDKPPAVANFNGAAYAPVASMPPHHPHPSPVAYQPAPSPALGRPAARVADHDEAAAQNKPPPPVKAYPVSVPQQAASPPPAKPDAYRQTSPTPTAPRPAARDEAARAPAPAAAPAPTTPPPPPKARNNDGGLGQAGTTTHVYMGPQSQIIFGPAGKKGGGDGNWASLHDTQGNWASATESMTVSVISPRTRNEDRWRPSLLPKSQSQNHTQQQQQAASNPVAAPSHTHHPLAASPFSSRSSSFSSPLSPYSSAHPSPSSSAHSNTRSSYSSAHPSPSAHSSTRSPYSSAHPSPSPFSSTHSLYSSPHPSAATSPHSPLRPSPTNDAATKVTHGINDSFRSTSSRGAAVSSPLPSNSPIVPNHSRGAAISSPLPSSTPIVTNHSSVVRSLSAQH